MAAFVSILLIEKIGKLTRLAEELICPDTPESDELERARQQCLVAVKSEEKQVSAVIFQLAMCSSVSATGSSTRSVSYLIYFAGNYLAWWRSGRQSVAA